MDVEHLIHELDIPDLSSKIRRELHRHPEIAGHEIETGKRIASYLEQFGIPYETGVADTGIVAMIKGAKPGNVVALRADIDALPTQEANDVPYRSEIDGMMHACGHDGHTAIVLCAAKVLNQMKDELCGTVKLFFQPAEEGCGGAERMIQAGCLENPKVDYVLGLHMAPQYEAGIVGVKYGKMMAASDEVVITISGKSCHGAHPDQGVDAILIAAHILTALQSVVSRNISPTSSAVCSFGKIQGGSAQNAIADRVEIRGILRTLDLDMRALVKSRVSAMAKGIAQAMGGEAVVDFRVSYSPLINTAEVVDVVQSNAIKLLGSNRVIIEEEADLGTEDFSYFALATKACFFHLGCSDKAHGITADLHNSHFDIAEACLPLGVRLQVENVLALLACSPDHM